MELLRKFATPFAIGIFAGLATTGLIMFFEISDSVHGLHEWLGVAFVVAALLHLTRNWRSFLNMFSAARSKAVMGILAGGAAVLIAVSLTNPEQEGGPQGIVGMIAAAPIEKMAPALNLTGDTVIERLKAGGVTATPDQSLAEIAQAQNMEMPRLLGMVTGQKRD